MRLFKRKPVVQPEIPLEEPVFREDPITWEDIEYARQHPVRRQPVKLMNKGDTPLDKHYKLLDRIIRSYW